ncbi:MAG TPA: hypothetical protein VFX22_06765, partial [Candidatus Kapabacteria bacterium]|nr:hypothetical protein [Candidatus Kapabacteria bacterium]
MKFFISVFLCIFAISARAQITLEYTYPPSAYSQGLSLAEVDSATWKYILLNDDSILIFNLDHSLQTIIPVPPSRPFIETEVVVIAKNLFGTDGGYDYMLTGQDSTFYHEMQVYSENGNILFSCDTCAPYPDPFTTSDLRYINNPNEVSVFIKTTDQGTKMLITRGGNDSIRVYSLPGKLPSCSNALLGVTPSNSVGTNPSLPTSAYPNPSQGRVRIAYQLPSGVSSGEVVLTDEEGREVNRYHVTSAFSDLEIQESDLPGGSY